ncbi:hypothetical protein ED733_005311 [Metarhizium rileyi]|uniref:FAD binding domain protein n=1 Tax=Metarhizium rileyi (strain RCEF 4871) TaxID=1649241 RepID=A0A5C6GLW0_METRR|nr:hypothetical protein ED733_005311 [Metarhizium rileyi]
MSEANQGPGPLEPVKRYLVKSLAGGIGLASEGIASYKERKRLRRTGLPADSIFLPDTMVSPRPSDGTAPNNGRKLATPPPHDCEKDQHCRDEKLWTLDEAQDELSPPPYTERATVSDGGSLATTSPCPGGLEEFLKQHPAPEHGAAFARAKLPQPVILPQKRPKTRTRGFIRAYAPSLGQCGIPQDMFLDFMTAFDTSTQASPWLDAINLASIGLSFIPHFPMLVGIAIQVSITAAKDVQSRARTNSFLDKANAQIFMPRGLYCIIMTYSPEQVGDSPSLPGTDVSSAIASKVASTGLPRFQNRFRESSGHACEAELPESAPLVFPGLHADSSAEELGESKDTREKMKRAQKYITDYYDKRAQAKFAAKHEGSGLVKCRAPKFTSRFADPNHPACSGSFRSLITGGYITPPEMGKSRSEQGHEGNKDDLGNSKENGRTASRDQDLIRLGPVGLPTPGTLVKKAFKKNVLYMTIVNMPSEEELALASEHLRQSRSKGVQTSDFITHLRGN